MRDWLPAEHLVWWLIELLDSLDVSAFEARSKLGRAGRRPFAPRTLLAILIYGYAHGERSSRHLERLCETDIAFRVLAGNGSGQDGPDHATLARFRQRHEAAFEEVFTQVLMMCAKAGLGRLGVVAIDGTKIGADASKQANRSEQRLREEFGATASGIVREAGEVDAAEDAEFGDRRGDELPPEMAPGPGRREQIRKILAELDEGKAREAEAKQKAQDGTAERAAQWLRRATDPDLTPQQRRFMGEPPRSIDRVAVAQARLDRQIQQAQQRLADRAEREALAATQGRRLSGPAMRAVEEHGYVQRARRQLEAAQARAAVAAAQPTPAASPGASPKKVIRNLTDPDSRLMPTAQGGWVQGYNAQLAVSDDQIILAVEVVNSSNDVEQFVPMMRAAQAAAEQIIAARPTPVEGEQLGTIAADAGYLSVDNLTADGPDRLIALGKARDQHREAREHPTSGPPPEAAGPIEQMSHRLRTPEGSRLYKRRGVTVEPVNGHLKDRIGLRRFSRRGLTAAHSELHLAATVANILKLYRVQTI